VVHERAAAKGSRLAFGLTLVLFDLLLQDREALLEMGQGGAQLRDLPIALLTAGTGWLLSLRICEPTTHR
jgi:hypothetical protein